MIAKSNDYKSNPETIKKMFGDIAPNYDLANSLLSFNLHKTWNKALVKNTTLNHPATLLDLCAGTGEIAYTWVKMSEKMSEKMSPKELILIDFCPEMLKKAESRKPLNSPHKISFIEADAQEIPLASESVEAITMAYGIRNVKNPLTCFNEALRVLKPGGILGILELTEPKNPLIRMGHNFYLKRILPTIGGIITQKPEAYKYLSTSIQAFVDPKTLSEDLKGAGFESVILKPLTYGIAHLFLAQKSLLKSTGKE